MSMLFSGTGVRKSEWYDEYEGICTRTGIKCQES